MPINETIAAEVRRFKEKTASCSRTMPFTPSKVVGNTGKSIKNTMGRIVKQRKVAGVEYETFESVCIYFCIRIYSEM